MTMSRRQVLGYGLGLGALVVTGTSACSDDEAASQGAGGEDATGSASGDGATTSVGPPVASSDATSADCCSSSEGGRWSSPATWTSGSVPAPGEGVDIDGPVVLDTDVDVATLRIMPEAALSFDPEASLSLTSAGNVLVLGDLVMRPARADVQHRLAFRDVDESAFVGGGMDVLDTDVGLWVTAAGAVDLHGATKLAWTRAAGSLSAGDRSIELEAEPAGWNPGDELVVTPTASPSPDEEDEDNPHESHRDEVVTIESIEGNVVRLTEPLGFPHPRIDLGPAGALGAEVLNLTRNVAIEGTPEGRSHVIIVHVSRPQSIGYVGFRHLGPNQEDDGVIGRYGLHFHHCADGSAGSMIEGAVARDIGNHAFVPHESAGTTWLDCISYETWDDAYWWDAGDQSVDTVFDRCVAVNVWPHEANKYTTGGFRLGLGPADTNVVRNCVAANVAGFGFLWYDGSEGDWVANDCVAHNVIGSGLWVWQNNNIDQVISDFICYNNDVYGIDHGAYGNGYVYEGGAFVGNAAGPVAISAVANHNSTGGGLRFSGLYCDASGADFGIIVPDGAPVEASLPTVIENCRIVNASQACIFWHGSGADAWAEVRDCEFEGNEILLDDEVGSNTRIELFDARLGNLLVTRGDQAGEAVPEWNAVVQAI